MILHEPSSLAIKFLLTFENIEKIRLILANELIYAGIPNRFLHTVLPYDLIEK
jgi:hypothetical protein